MITIFSFFGRACYMMELRSFKRLIIEQNLSLSFMYTGNDSCSGNDRYSGLQEPDRFSATYVVAYNRFWGTQYDLIE